MKLLDLNNKITQILELSVSPKLSEKQIAAKLGFSQSFDRSVLSSVLREMEKNCEIVFFDGKYALLARSGLKRGVIRRHERGFAFFIPDDQSGDLFVAPKFLDGIYQGDCVLVREVATENGKGDECEPVKVISRGEKIIAGVYFCDKGRALVYPDDKSFGAEIVVKRAGREVDDGNEVLCEITAYPANKPPQGKIIKVLGDPSDYRVRENALLAKSGVPDGFSAEVIAEVNAFTDTLSDSDFCGREDFRKLITFTIDGDDSRDFDDAISIMKTGEGYKLFVHIADVSHYVKEGGEIDAEAFNRGTSVYFPDRVVPMLPERLSNGLCSLNPNEDSLALTAVLDYDFNGELQNKCFYKSIIRSNARLTYKNVQAFFDGDAEVKKQLKAVGKELKIALELAKKLSAAAKANGYIDLDCAESKIYVEDGEIIVEARERLQSEELIERFMIAANVAVAEYVSCLDLPFIYRVHDKPSEEKCEALGEFLKTFGLVLKNRKSREIYPSDFQKMLESVSDSELRSIIDNVTLRTMQKAKYSAENVGHFGLNEKFYCHFTSPIRRYPDLVVHRILKGVLEGEYQKIADKYKDFCSVAAEQSSEREKKAEILERSIDDLYICEFMSQWTGDYFEGVISGVTSFGFFVRIENSAEGLVKLDTLPQKNYVFDEKRLVLSSGRKQFKLGKKVLVRLVRCDKSTSKLSFAYVGDI